MQSVASPIADPGVVNLIPARSHTFLEIDHEMFSTVLLLLWVIQEGYCQLQVICALSIGYLHSPGLPRKNSTVSHSDFS